jgi:dTDP-4-dehydrorhamnose reductase
MILVFGKTGQVATELQRLGDVVALGRDQADLSNPAACADAIRTLAPRAVINAAAYTAVDRAEEEGAMAPTITQHLRLLIRIISLLLIQTSN